MKTLGPCSSNFPHPIVACENLADPRSNFERPNRSLRLRGTVSTKKAKTLNEQWYYLLKKAKERDTTPTILIKFPAFLQRWVVRKDKTKIIGFPPCVDLWEGSKTWWGGTQPPKLLRLEQWLLCEADRIACIRVTCRGSKRNARIAFQ